EENLVKESQEEAGIPEQLVRAAKRTGTITYARQQAHMLRRDTLFVFDLELPASFTPVNQDGEVLDFRLMEATEVVDRLLNHDDFKFNVPLVLIDFLMRRGMIERDSALESGLNGAHFPSRK